VDRDSLTLLLAQGVSVEQIGKRFGKHPSTIAYWMAKFGLVAPNRDTHLAKGGIERERLEELVAQGMSIAEMAEELGRGKSTVRHWLGRYGLQTTGSRGRSRRKPAEAAREAGKLTTTLECERHGSTEFILEGRGYYRCKRCRSEAVSEHRRKVKGTLVAEAGGGCVLCGYNRSGRALAFHHLDPSQKQLPVSWNGVTVAIDTVRAEARKCVLLCSNCHAEVEDGAISVPLEFHEPPVTEAIHHNPG
jgi:transposase